MSIYRGQEFVNRPTATAYVQDALLREGKSAVLSKTIRSAHNWQYQCSSETPCTFFVRMLRSHRANGGGCFVTKCNLEHINCTSAPRVNRRQGVQLLEVQAAVSADAKIPAHALVQQIQATSGLKIKTRTAYRIRDAVVEANYGSYVEGIQKLEGLLSEFGSLNGEQFTGVERDVDERFLRLFVVHPLAARYQRGLQPVLGIDGTHLKHPRYKGVMIVLVGRDGNNQNVLLAFAICHAESTGNYSWFLNRCKAAGVTLSATPLFADRNAGLIAAVTLQGDIPLRFCVRHILDNVRDRFLSKTKDEKGDIESYIWRAQRATSEEEFDGILAALAITHRDVVEYVREIGAVHWAIYPIIHEYKLYGWTTTSFVEAQNSAALKDRLLPLYQFVETQLSGMMMKARQRSQDVRQWVKSSRILTPHGQELYDEQAKLVGFYGIMPSTSTRAYVWDSRRTVKIKHLVDIGARTCRCTTRVQMGIPCRHILAVLFDWKRETEVFEYFDPCFLVVNARAWLTLPLGAFGRRQLLEMRVEVTTASGNERRRDDNF